MREYTYLLFNLLILTPPLILSIKTDVKTYKNWRGLLVGLFCVSLPFIFWDIWAASNGHWFFSSEFITSPRFFNVPYEEIFFFVSVPFAMCFVWDVLQKHIKNHDVSEIYSSLGMALIALSSFLLLFAQWGNGYSRSVAIATLVALFVIIYSRWWRRNIFWWFQLVLFVLFFVTNTFLTALPVITYGDSSFIGWRIGTIPVEDFFFNFALINLFVIIYDKYSNN